MRFFSSPLNSAASWPWCASMAGKTLPIVSLALAGLLARSKKAARPSCLAFSAGRPAFQQRGENAVIAVFLVGGERFDPVEQLQHAIKLQHRGGAARRRHLQRAVVDARDCDVSDMGQVARGDEGEHGQVAEGVRDVEHDALLPFHRCGELPEHGDLLAGIARIRDQQAGDRTAELFAQPRAMPFEQGRIDPPFGDRLDQRQQLVVVRSLLLEEDVPHAAGSADEDQPRSGRRRSASARPK